MCKEYCQQLFIWVLNPHPTNIFNKQEVLTGFLWDPKKNTQNNGPSQLFSHYLFRKVTAKLHIVYNENI